MKSSIFSKKNSQPVCAEHPAPKAAGMPAGALRTAWGTRAAWVLGVGVLIIALLTAPRAHGFTLSGYYKNFFVADRLPSAVHEQVGLEGAWVGSVSQRLRLDAFHRFNDRLAFNLSYALAARVQDPILFGNQLYGNAPFIGFINAAGYRAYDLEALLYPRDGSEVESLAMLQNLDRLFVTLNFKPFDVYLGRQAIAWGAARVINPTDVIAPFLYTELDTEDRVGVDAARLRAPIGTLGELDVGYVAGHDFEFSQSAFFARGKTYVAKTGVTGLVVGFREHLMFGADVTRTIGGAGSWLEAAYVFADALGDNRHGTGNDYLRLSVGCDYNFPHDIYAYIEYHYNEPGAIDSDDYHTAVFEPAYRDSIPRPAYRDGADYLLGKHYLAPGATFQITGLMTLLTQALVNLTDPSALLVGTLDYNISENIYLQFGGYIGVGGRPDLYISLDPSDDESFLVFNSEFGSYPDTYYTSFRVYF